MIALIIVLIALAAVATIVLIFVVSHYKKRAWTLERVPATPAGDIDERGVVKVVGKVIPLDRTLWSPLTGRECVYYRLIIEDRRDEEDRDWRSLVKDVKSVPFTVKDATGKAIVDGKDLDVDIRSGRRIDSGYLGDLSGAKEEKLRDLYPDEKLSFSKKMRFEEVVIELGDRLAVTGEVDLPKNGPPTFRSGKKNQIELSDLTEFPEAERSRGAAKTSLIFTFVSGACTIGFGIWLTLVLVSRKNKSLDDRGAQANSGNNSRVDGNRQNDVIVIGREGMPAGADLDSVLTRLNDNLQRADFHLYQLELANLRVFKQKPDFKRRADVLRVLRGLASIPNGQGQPFSFADTAWRELLAWMDKGDTLDLCQMLAAERSESRQSDIFGKLREWKDPRCAQSIAAYLAVEQRRFDAANVLKLLDSTAEKAVLPYLAANQDKETRRAAIDVVGEIGTIEGAKIIEAMTRDTDLQVSSVAKRIFFALSKKFPVDQDLLATVKAAQRRDPGNERVGDARLFASARKGVQAEPSPARGDF